MSDPSTSYHTILNNIQNLQEREKGLYSELEALPPHSNFERQRAIVAEINKTSMEKINLFKNLYALNTLLQQDIARGNDDLAARIEIAKLMEKQLAESQERIKRTRNENINSLRQTEINHYFSDRYRAFGGIFLYIIYVCVALIIIAVLRRRYILSSRVSNLLAAIVIIVGLGLVLPAFYDIDARNNMVFAEYDFEFDPSSSKNPQHSDKSNEHMDFWMTHKDEDTQKKYDKDIKLLKEGDCVGPECCSGPGLRYDKHAEACVVDKGHESFGNISGQSGGGGASLDDPNTYSSLLVHVNPSGKYYSAN